MNQKDRRSLIIQATWQTTNGFRGIGNALLLKEPLTAFFASRQCSGAAIRTAMDWAVQQARSRTALIGGFHSPLEKSVLELMLAADAPVVIVIARSVEQARLPPSWQRAVRLGTAAVVGLENAPARLTSESAARRNDWVAERAANIVLAHVAAGGGLARQAAQWKSAGRHLSVLTG